MSLELLINQGTFGDPESMFVASPDFQVNHDLKFEKRGQVSFGDVNGDQRPDMLIPAATNGRSRIESYYWPWVDSQGLVDAVLVGDPTLTVGDGATRPEPILLLDIFGDGAIDFAVLGEHDNDSRDVFPRVWDQTVNSSNRFTPSRAVTSINDGLNAKSTIEYLPMTSPRVYRRDTGNEWYSNPQDLDGAPVYDMVNATYVVSKVSSSMPSVLPANNPDVVSTYDSNAMTSVEYFYTGSKLQGHGRGPLGFRQVGSFNSDTRIATVTEYHQVYPKTGLPKNTAQFYIPTSTDPWPQTHHYDHIPLCTFNCDQAFFHYDDTTSTPTWQVPNGADILSQSHSSWGEYWGEAGNETGSGYVYLYQSSAVETSYQPESIIFGGISQSRPIKRVETEMLPLNGSVIDSFGNVLKLRVQTFDETEGGSNAAATQTTVNNFLTESTSWIDQPNPSSVDVTDLPNWKLGRLDCSVVHHQRNGQSGFRASAFAYDSSGRLSDEYAGLDVSGMSAGTLDDWCASQSPTHTAWNAISAMHTQYVRDAAAFGRVTETLTSYAEDLGDLATKRVRGRKVEFDSEGRYAETEQQLASDQPISWVMMRSIDDRDRYGNPTKVTDQFGQEHYSTYEASGRLRATASSTGEIVVHAVVNTHSRCPAGQTAYAEVSAVAVGDNPGDGMLSVSCKDRLGREVRSATRNFNENTAGAPWSYIDTYYDFQSRAVAVSEPYHTGSYCSAPGFDLTCTDPLFNITHLDPIGRPLRMDMPTVNLNTGNSGQKYVRNDYSEFTTTSTDPAGFETQVVSNALGEKEQEVTQAGVRTEFDYDV
ncbi:MAG: hypothetical protein AAGH65_10535, partial [Pseudomonadota bacterium]